ncbi:MAG: hypothetical protein RLY86_3105 [Pseudomonadota bacterium]|jgi:two-component sensor histidine kinase
MAKPELATGIPEPGTTVDGLDSLSREDLVTRCRSLRRDLDCREAMLRELQHRAKNSLQLVTSMLRLQHHRIADPEARAAYDQTMHRVEVLAILYRQFHETRSEADVDLKRFAEEICETAIDNAGDLPAPVQVTVQAERLRTSLYTAMPFGLILNELVASGLRHAFGDAGRMEVRIEGGPGDQARLTVSDTGRALPAGFDAEADASTMLVEALATQLGADLDISTLRGSSVTLTLKL